MRVKKFKVDLLKGPKVLEMFATPTAIIKKFGASNIKKISEVYVDVDTGSKNLNEFALEISARDKNDIQLSFDCGYTVSYNKPNEDKIFEGMLYFETSDEEVLVAEFDHWEKYDKMLHHHWKGPGYRPEKEWEWALFHKNAKIVPRTEVEKEYGKIVGRQGGIGYVKL
jgi:hypothetical protein